MQKKSGHKVQRSVETSSPIHVLPVDGVALTLSLEMKHLKLRNGGEERIQKAPVLPLLQYICS